MAQRHSILQPHAFNIPATCAPLASCNYTFGLWDPFFTSVGSDGWENINLLDGNGTVEFQFFVVNGAGNGNAATYVLQRKTPTGYDIISI